MVKIEWLYRPEGCPWAQGGVQPPSLALRGGSPLVQALLEIWARHISCAADANLRGRPVRHAKTWRRQPGPGAESLACCAPTL